MISKLRLITSCRNESNNAGIQSDLAAENDFNHIVDARSLMTDLKILISDYYVATFIEDGQALKLIFNNGQIFKISVKECDKI